MSLTWKEIEIFISDMTEEQKSKDVVLIDNILDQITYIDSIEVVTTTVYRSEYYDELMYESDITDWNEERLKDFDQSIIDAVYEGEFALIV